MKMAQAKARVCILTRVEAKIDIFTREYLTFARENVFYPSGARLDVQILKIGF